MYPAFAVCGSDAYGNVLYRTSEPRHRMAFEMGQDNREIIVRIMRAYDVIVYVPSALHRKPGFSFGIHNVHFCNGGETVLLGGTEMGGCVGAASAVCRIAFHDSAVHTLHEVSYQGRLQKVVSARFACREFHGYFTGSLTPQCFINSHQSFRRNVACDIHGGCGNRVRSFRHRRLRPGWFLIGLCPGTT